MARLAGHEVVTGAPAHRAPGTGTGGRDSLERLETFLSPYTGIVRRIHESFHAPDDARMTLVGCRIASAEPTTGSGFELNAAGAHYDRDQAIAAALGEAVERYAGTCLPAGSDVVFASASDIGPSAVQPERWALFSEDQYAQDGFPFEPFRDGTKIRWVKGWSIPDRTEAYLPLQLAYMVRPGNHAPGEAPIAYGSSNGMALATTTEEAVLGGLLELIERDAVMLTWAGRLTHPRLDWWDDERLVEHEDRHFTPTGVAYDVIDLSVFFGVPTALALVPGRPLRDAGPDAALWGIGAASAPTMAQAWDKALRECFQTRASLRGDLLAEPQPRLTDPLSIESPEDHMHFYARTAAQAKLAVVTGSEKVRRIQDVPALPGDGPAEWVEDIARRLEERGASAYAVDITPPDVAEAGLQVLHVLSPELQPLDFPHRFRFLGGRRLYDAAHELGLRDQPFGPDDLNPDPHPFP